MKMKTRTVVAVLVLAVSAVSARGLPTSPPAAKRDLENDIDFEGAVSSGELVTEANVDAEGTVAEVQRILDKYPQLPRLSRGDILTILDNITRASGLADQTTTTAASVEATTELLTTAASPEESATTFAFTTTTARAEADRGDHGRELMVVLPFNAKNLSESNIKELYTKAPLTHIIGDPTPTSASTSSDLLSMAVKPKTKPAGRRPQRRRPASTTVAAPATSTSPAPSVYKVTEQLESDAPPPDLLIELRDGAWPEKKLYAQQQEKRRRTSPVTTSTTSPKPETHEEQHDVDYTTKKRPWREHRRTTTASTATSTATSTTTSTTAPEPSVVPSNHKPYYTEPTVKPWKATTPQPSKKTANKHKLEHHEGDLKRQPESWLPVPAEPAKESTWKSPRPTARPAPPRGAVLPSLFDMKKAVLPATTMRPVLRDDVKGLLASIGLKSDAADVAPKRSTLAPTTSTTTTTTEPPVPNAADAAESLTPEMKDILMSIGLLPGKGEPALPTPGTRPLPMPTITTQPVVPMVDPSSYVQFKPLPIASTSQQGQQDNDMQEFLASFGLVPAIQSAKIVSSPEEYFNMDDLSGGRSAKALLEEAEKVAPESTRTGASSEPETDPDNTSYAELGNEEPLPTAASLVDKPDEAPMPDLPLPEDMKSVLESLGLGVALSGRQPKRIDAHPSEKGSSQPSRAHIFNPVAHSAKLDDRREAERVIKLLSSIRVLPVAPNGTEIIPESIVSELTSIGAATATANTTPKYGFRKKEKPGKKQESNHRLESEGGPSPLSSEELNLYLETAKNEVKRQQAASSASSSASSSSASSSSSSSSSDSEASTAVVPGYDDNAAELPTTVGDSLAGEGVTTALEEGTTTPSSTSSSTSSTTTTTTTTTTTEAPTANLDDLAESFGGDGDRPKNNGAPVDTLPPARPNGLYFLFDWNTFLNVGEEGKNPVRLNFAPRIGDPKRFIEVKVP